MPEEPQLQSYLQLTVPLPTPGFPSSSASSALSANSALILIRVFASLLPYFVTSFSANKKSPENAPGIANLLAKSLFLQLPPPLHRLHHRHLVRILQIRPHGNP